MSNLKTEIKKHFFLKTLIFTHHHMQPGEPPLDEIQPTFTATGTDALGNKGTYTYYSASLLHRLAFYGSVSTLERRSNELTPEMLNNTKCWSERIREGAVYTFTEVR